MSDEQQAQAVLEMLTDVFVCQGDCGRIISSHTSYGTKCFWCALDDIDGYYPVCRINHNGYPIVRGAMPDIS